MVGTKTVLGSIPKWYSCISLQTLVEQCCQEDLVPRKRKDPGLWEIYLAGRLSPFHLASWMKGPPQMLGSSVSFYTGVAPATTRPLDLPCGSVQF